MASQIFTGLCVGGPADGESYAGRAANLSGMSAPAVKIIVRSSSGKSTEHVYAWQNGSWVYQYTDEEM